MGEDLSSAIKNLAASSENTLSYSTFTQAVKQACEKASKQSMRLSLVSVVYTVHKSEAVLKFKPPIDFHTKLLKLIEQEYKTLAKRPLQLSIAKITQQSTGRDFIMTLNVKGQVK